MELEVIKTLLWVIGSLMAVLTGLVAWIGMRVHLSLDSMSSSLVAIKEELSADIGRHTTDIAVLYSRCRANHGEDTFTRGHKCS